jgi:hypothetical protein
MSSTTMPWMKTPPNPYRVILIVVLAVVLFLSMTAHGQDAVPPIAVPTANTATQVPKIVSDWGGALPAYVCDLRSVVAHLRRSAQDSGIEGAGRSQSVRQCRGQVGRDLPPTARSATEADRRG